MIRSPWLMLALVGCTEFGAGPRPIIDGPGFFDRPWPDDRRMVDGHPDFSGFPGVDEYPLIEDYVAQADKIDGFGPASPLYLRFKSALEVPALPDPATSMTTDSPLWLVNIDPRSPRRGALVPFTTTYFAEATDWIPDNLLAVQPVWGTPLEPSTTYALVVSTDIAQAPAGFEKVWEADHADHALYEPLAETLFQLHIDIDRVAHAQVFTTQDTSWEMAAIADRIHGGLAVGPIAEEVTRTLMGIHFTAWQGNLWIPIWQTGESPYVAEGGDFTFDDGAPVLQGWEHVGFSLTVPKDTADMPTDGYPTVIYSHGTGGDLTSFCDEKDGMEVAGMLAKAGIAGFGISLPFHGDRNTGGDPAILSFNYFNPEAGRTNFRAAALDQVFLAAALSAESRSFWSEAGLDVHLDPDRVAYMGHSHGGEIGALAVPHFRDAVDGVVLSGTGGGLSVTLTSRDAGDFDIQGILVNTFELTEDEFTETHPLVGMVQLLSEVTDPINAGPYWHRNAPPFESRPQPVLMFEGLNDIYTPPRAIEALAGSAGIPIVAPVAQQWTVQELQDIDGIELPVANNRPAWDGEDITTALSQWPEHGHFPIFDDKDAATLYQGFLASTLAGAPEVSEAED